MQMVQPIDDRIVKNYKRTVYRDMVLALFNVIQINVSNMHTITLGN